VVSRIAALLVVLVVASGAARAQGARTDQAQSKALYDEGSRAYKAGDYPRAIELFLAAYDLSHVPAILFNVAQAYRLAGTCDRALEYYRRSLEEEPEAANRAEVEERITEMERCAEEKAARQREAAEPDDDPGSAVAASPSEDASTPPNVVSAPAPERPPPRRSILPLVTVGVGTAAAVAGGILYLEARAKFAQVEATCPCEPGSFSGWETATDVSYVLMGAGALAAGAGLVWWWRGTHNAPARMGVVPTAGGALWTGSF
jgi:tetratricopeptide (TPR) repeat protein